MAETLNRAESNFFTDQSLCFDGVWAWLVFLLLLTLGITFILWLLYKCIQGPFYKKNNRIEGKVVIITGCNSGIGKQTALELAQRGGRIYMACRDAARCEAARLEIIERTNNQQVFNRHLDLSSLASVRQFVERFSAEEQRLDILINNAGLMSSPRKLTADGFEQQIGVNHLGHFLLTNLLLDKLKQSAPSRIVVVSSELYIFGRIKKHDLMSEKSYSNFSAYNQSKLANILFTRKLSELLEGTRVTVNCLHPGVVRTELLRNATYPTWISSPLHYLLRFFIKSPKAGAQTTIHLAIHPGLEDKSGGFYMDCMKYPLLPWARNKETADWLWNESEKLVGLRGTNTQSTNSTDTTIVINGNESSVK